MNYVYREETEDGNSGEICLCAECIPSYKAMHAQLNDPITLSSLGQTNGTCDQCGGVYRWNGEKMVTMYEEEGEE